MPNPIIPDDPGLLSSVAQFLGHGGSLARNIALGNFEGAGRNFVDAAGDIADSIAPGDWIPHISRKEDHPEFRDIVDTGDDLIGETLNFLGNVATDPVTYIPGAAIAKGAGAIGKGVSKITPKIVKDAVRPIAAKAGKLIKKTAGAEQIGKELENVKTRAQGARETAARSSGDAIVEGLKGATPRELEAATEVLTNVTRDKATKAARVLDETETMNAQQRLAQYLQTNPDVDPERMLRIINTSTSVGRGQAESGQAGNIFTTGASRNSPAEAGNLVRDEAGNPLELFHGTDDPSSLSKDIPTWLTNSEKSPFVSGKQNTKRVNVSSLSPLTPDVAQQRLPEIAAAFDRFAVPEANKQEILRYIKSGNPAAWYYVPDEAKKAYQSLGYDSIHVNAGMNEQWWVPFSGKQVSEVGAKARTNPIGKLEEEYFPRVMKQDETDDLVNDMLGQPNAIAERKLKTSNDLATYLTAHPEVSLANAAEALGKRGAAQGELAARGAAGQGLFDMARAGNTAFPDELLAKVPVKGKPAGGVETGLDDVQRKEARDWLLSKPYKQADPLLREAAETIARALPGDEADVALHMLKGMEARKGFPKMLASLNSKFKPVAVFGALVPKLGSITRNMTGGVWQKYSNPEARGTISPKNIPGFLRDWWASMEDGVERLFGARLFTKNEFSQIDEAYKASGGDPRKALALIRDPDMRSAVERGVFGNNFVDTENLIAQTQRSGALKFAEKAWDYPAAMFKGAETRMRYGLYKSLVKGGKSEDDAARIVRESLYDYSPSSMENRLARDVIPFFQFLAKSIPQQGKLMAEKPWLASTVANAYAQGRDEPVSPMMEGKLNIPLGLDEMGNRQYLSNLGLPFESLSMIPNLSANPLQAGRDIEQNIVGSTTPLLKNVMAYTFGRDPTFGSIPGSYTKIAGQDLGQVGGFLNQVAGTGLAPLTAAQQIASLAGRTVDDRTTLPEKLLQNLTGARIQSVDPDRAIQQRLQSYLERDPSIGQFRQFYDKGEDVDAQQLLQGLQEARKALKDKAKATANVN